MDKSNGVTKANLKGCIKKIICDHFMAFDQIEVELGTFLNIIIGPNGSGKSTLAAAIVLGLGGDPKQLSRSANAGEFVKNGYDEAAVAIVIHMDNSGNCILFRRTIDLNGRSEFFIEASKVNKKAYQARISTFNIEISNLCQFLPQDRVQDFAKMTPQELFVNTIQSTTNTDVIEVFNQLKELQKGQVAIVKTFNDIRATLDFILKRLQELKEKMEHYRTRQNVVLKIKVCSAKKRWLELKNIETQLLELKRDLKKAEEINKGREKEHLNAEKNYRVVENNFEKFTSEIEDLKRSERALTLAREKTFQNIVESDHNIKNLANIFKAQKENMKVLKMKEMDVARKLQVMIDACTKLKSQNPAAQVTNLERELNNLKQEIKNLGNVRNDINKRIDEECTAELTSIDFKIKSKNGAELKTEFLRGSSPDVLKAWSWIEQNQSKFQGKVYRPMLFEINVRERSKIKYFENTISPPDLFAFACEDKSDVQLLAQQLCKAQKLLVNVVHCSPATECSFTPPIDIDELRGIGFTEYLIDLIEGPPAILNYLCELYSLHKIPIGTDKIGECTDIPSELKIYFGGDYRYSVITSRYSTETSHMQSGIVDRGWPMDDNKAELAALQKQRQTLVAKADALKNKRSSLDAKIDEHLFKQQELVTKKKAAAASQQRLLKLMDQIRITKAEISELKSSCNIDELEQAMKRDIDAEGNRQLKLLVEYSMAFAKEAAAKKKREYMQYDIIISEKENHDLRVLVDAAKERLREWKGTYENIKQSVDSAERAKHSKMTEAERLTDNIPPDHPKFPYKDIYNSLPDNLDGVGQVLNELNARLECMGNEDQQAMKEYMEKSAESQEYEKKLKENAIALEKGKVTIRSLFEGWFVDVNSVISNVNENFGNFMTTMGYVGEVGLARNDEFDFASYGIDIRVQYRKNVPLQRLSRNLQSGGERAVAIGTYTLAVLCMNNVPFGCVDEINQGMDPINERTFLEMLLKETADADRPQYIYISPKMPTGLTDNLDFDHVAVHIVASGHILNEHQQRKRKLN